jgi:YVTN family beta-propeller protein
MQSRSLVIGLLVALLTGALPFTTFGDASPPVPGPLGGGVTLLPNGWKIAPAGRHVQVGSLPLAMVESSDGRFLFITNNGYLKPSITVVDIKARRVAETLVLDHAWLGLAWNPDGRRLYASGAGNSTVHELRWDRRQLPPPIPSEGVTPSDIKSPPIFGMTLARGDDLVLGRPMPVQAPGLEPRETVPQSFIGGIAVSPDGSRLFAVHVLGQLVSAVDLKTGHVLGSISLPAEPYTCAISPDGATLFVSLWGGAKVLLFDARTLEARGAVDVGEHPNAMAVTRDGARLFVACANTNAVWVVDVARRRAVEQIKVSIYPDAPPGSTPNSVSLSPDGARLVVANADNNTVAVVDVSSARSEVLGFIPTGWYPTSALVSRDNSQVFVLSGKGLTSSANPRYMPRSLPGGDMTYVGAMLTGTLSILPNPDPSALRGLTATARSLIRYTDDHRLAPESPPGASPIPKRVGDPSPIKHVFYVIRENRTYDQVFGDLDRGNGDPTLTLFGEQITPNAHALAREFGVLDNFYVDAEVSYDGHAFSLAAYATDLVEKFWPTEYASRGAAYLGEGIGGTIRNAYGNIAAPANGYLWDAAARAKVSYRSYGEYAHWAPGTEADRIAGRAKALASVPGLVGHINEIYPPWDLQITDNRRLDVWEREFRSDVAEGRVPALSIVYLPNDHTGGTRPRTPTPRAMVADNDLAVGRLVDVISHSSIWTDSAIFILEDDAQDGPDHVDAHRSPALVISPFSRRQRVDSTMYSTSSMVRTIELILGLPPMSQYDASAAPMYNAMQPTPNLQPFTLVRARISLDEKNDELAYGAAASLGMNLADADMAPERELNEILWRSIKGVSATLPPVVRSAFVRSAHRGDGDDAR